MKYLTYVGNPFIIIFGITYLYVAETPKYYALVGVIGIILSTIGYVGMYRAKKTKKRLGN